MAVKRIWDWLFPWRYDERNPYRRYCKECGTQQSAFSYWSGNRIHGWDTMRPVHPCSKEH